MLIFLNIKQDILCAFLRKEGDVKSITDYGNIQILFNKEIISVSGAVHDWIVNDNAQLTMPFSSHESICSDEGTDLAETDQYIKITAADLCDNTKSSVDPFNKKTTSATMDVIHNWVFQRFAKITTPFFPCESVHDGGGTDLAETGQDVEVSINKPCLNPFLAVIIPHLPISSEGFQCHCVYFQDFSDTVKHLEIDFTNMIFLSLDNNSK